MSEKSEIEKAVFAKYHHILLALAGLFEVEIFDDIFIAAEQLQVENKIKDGEIAELRKHHQLYLAEDGLKMNIVDENKRLKEFIEETDNKEAYKQWCNCNKAPKNK